ncbi:MAG: hypothetical protein K6C10_03885 [Prevotella sp.]|nr:hypothetical protein [Prevotella sp.]
MKNYLLNKPKWLVWVAAFLMSALTLPLQAQNVTIRPDNGSLITGQAGGNTGDSGIGRGMSSMWRHEQLPLMMTTSDIANLTSAGELADPSCAIDVYNGNLIIGAGQTQTFMVVSLPKGYRITGYTLVLQPNVYGNNIQLHTGKDSWNIGTDDQMSFYETPAWSSGNPYIRPNGTGNDLNTHCTLLDLDEYDYSYYAVATASDGSTVMQNNNATNRAKEFVISRTSQTETDMTNQLHFFFARASSQYAVTIKSFEIQFTAEGTFNAELTPSASGPAVSMVQSPFSTSKMDVGAITLQNGLYTYDYTGVRDLIAYNWIYQDDAINAGKPADVAVNKNIYPVVVDGKGVFAYGNDTYFVEPPTTITTASGWESPIGFRVVGAQFDYQWGTQTAGGTVTIANGYRISVTRDGTTYYLNDNLDFVNVNQNNAFVWQMDDLGNLYTGTDYKRYLACFGSGNERVLSLGSAASGAEATWNLRVADNGDVYYLSDGGNTYYLNYHYIQEGSAYHLRGYVTNGATTNLATATSTGGTHSVEVPSFTPGAYTLKIYGTDKNTVVKTVTVNSAADAGTYQLLGINNDAVKFVIEGLEGNTQALVNVSLQLEALDPYINSMDIVCQSEKDAQGKQLELIQTFTANDFSVSGGKFIFYIPTDYSNHDLTFTFRDLFSQYGDVTYGGTGNARYSFVTSPYFETVDGNGDNGLYDSGYDPNHACTDKIYTGVAGNIRFKFNNAEELTGSGTGTKTLQEYPFSVSTYLGSTDPDGSSKTGAFSDIVMNASKEDQKSGIYYVFTADETRYNIAPTTALEHRSYAFYRMDIELVARQYTPSLEWKKVYDVTCYADQDESGKDIEANKSMWGLTLRAKDTDGTYPESGGYLSVKEIMDAFNGVETQAHDGPTIGQEGAPESADQILYVDGSLLSTIVASSGYDLVSLRDALAKNVLIYLPENMTSTADNFAYKTASGSFMAGKNIVLTDRKPFYAPYDIQVQAAPNNITYTRDITWQTNGQVTNASIIVPFEIAVDANGVHSDSDGNKFSVHQIQTSGSCLSNNPLTEDDYIHVLPLVGMTKTVPNVPYVVKVESVASATGSTPSFIVKQTGALLKATSGMDANYEFAGTAGTGIDDKSSVTFTPTGSFSGKLLAKASNNVYYFAHNMFLDIQTLNRANLYVYPFRAYFRTSGGSSAKSLNIFYGENFDTTGINTVEEEPVMVDPNAPVYDIYGRMVATTVREIAGKNLPRGIYVVKGIKFNVK